MDLGGIAQQSELRDTKLNLLDSGHKEDIAPLVKGCQCFTCKNHTRAYVHHLLLVHEMTAQILLELHNVHQMLAWFQNIRQALSDRRFGQLKHDFLSHREDQAC